jgi:hypothetical protein
VAESDEVAASSDEHPEAGGEIVSDQPTDDEAVAGKTRTTAPQQEQASTSPCDKISCSHHGTCIERDGAPGCACDPGFVPDAATGLNCLRETPPPSMPPAQVVLSAEAARAHEEMNAAVASVAGVVPPDTARRYYFRYRSYLRANAFNGTYREFLDHTFSVQRTVGIIFITLGVCLGGGAAGLIVAGLNNMYRDGDLASALFFFGSLTAVAANVMLIMGIVGTAVGGARLRRLRAQGNAASSAMQRLRFSPYLARSPRALGSSAAYGLAARLDF